MGRLQVNITDKENNMTKFNEALDFIEATGDTSITTIMQAIGCSDTTAGFAVQAYKRNKANQANKSEPAQTADDIRQDKVKKACQLYLDICEADIELFKTSISLGMDPQETLDKLTHKLEMATSLLEVAEFAKRLKQDDSAS